MGLKAIRINARNWTDSAQDRDYWRALGTETPILLMELVLYTGLSNIRTHHMTFLATYIRGISITLQRGMNLYSSAPNKRHSVALLP